MASPDRIFLDFSIRKLDQLLGRIRDCAGKLTDEQVWMRGGDSSNAIGNLLLHLNGNVRQWIVSAVGGKPDIRVRDREFSARGDISASELLERLEATLGDAAGVLRNVTAERLGEMVHVQSYDVTVLEAVYHVVEHFSQHVGQIILLTKALTGEDTGFYRHLSEAAYGQKTP